MNATINQTLNVLRSMLPNIVRTPEGRAFRNLERARAVDSDTGQYLADDPAESTARHFVSYATTTTIAGLPEILGLPELTGDLQISTATRHAVQAINGPDLAVRFADAWAIATAVLASELPDMYAPDLNDAHDVHLWRMRAEQHLADALADPAVVTAAHEADRDDLAVTLGLLGQHRPGTTVLTVVPA